MILHVDMDAFFASIEERDNAGLRGKPMVVGGNPHQRGVVAAANYAARYFGIHSAMPVSRAKRLYPRLIVVPPQHRYYARVAQSIRDIFHRYTPLVEPLSLDEAFLDVNHSQRLFGTAIEIGRRIKQDIHRELRLIASVGVAENKFLAKIASDLSKPDGFLVIKPQDTQSLLDNLPVSKLWGVGKVGARRLEKRGIRTVGELRIYPRELLDDLFGSWGEKLWELMHGIDMRPVVPDHKAKSLSHETTFAEDVSDIEILRGSLLELIRQVASRLRRNQLYARTVQVKIRFANFRTITRSQTLSQPTNITQALWATGLALLINNLPHRPSRVRLLGFSVSSFDFVDSCQTDLFCDPGNSRQAYLDAVTDRINSRFGTDLIQHATEQLGADRDSRSD